MANQSEKPDEIEKEKVQSNFVLSPESWEAFCQALDAPPRDIPALRQLLTEKSVLERAETSAAG